MLNNCKDKGRKGLHFSQQKGKNYEEFPCWHIYQTAYSSGADVGQYASLTLSFLNSFQRTSLTKPKRRWPGILKGRKGFFSGTGTEPGVTMPYKAGESTKSILTSSLPPRAQKTKTITSMCM